MAKAEYPPLLPGGFHVRTIEQVRELCEIPFSTSKTRRTLMESLERAVGRIAAAAFPCELWINGSFLTEKADPSDVDIAVIVPSSIQMTASKGVRETLQWIESNETHKQHRIDGFVLTRFDSSSPMFPLWQESFAQFSRLFGTGYDDVTPKGVVLMKFQWGAS